MRYFISILIPFFLVQLASAQDTIITKKDHALIVHIVGLDSSQVYYKSLKKELKDTLTIAQSNIRIIRFYRSSNAETPYYSNKKNYKKGYQDGVSNSKNTINAALLGGGFLGIEYQRVIYKKNRWMLNAVVGAHLLPSITLSDFSFSAQFLGDVTFTNSKHYLEFGVSTSATFHALSSPLPLYGVAVGLIIGYRMQPSKGLFFRVYFNPTIFSIDGSLIPLPWIGLGLGYSF